MSDTIQDLLIEYAKTEVLLTLLDATPHYSDYDDTEREIISKTKSRYSKIGCRLHRDILNNLAMLSSKEFDEWATLHTVDSTPDVTGKIMANFREWLNSPSQET